VTVACIAARNPEATMDQHPLRRLIQSKLADSRLPYNSIPRVWGGAGDGETCDACDETITREQPLMEGIGTGKRGIQFTFGASRSGMSCDKSRSSNIVCPPGVALFCLHPGLLVDALGAKLR
jgi:hypothetical protein